MKQAPSFRNPPSKINPEATDIWRFALKKYADDIYEPKVLRDQWRKARSHFERLCGLKGVAPYQKLAYLAERIRKIADIADRSE